MKQFHFPERVTNLADSMIREMTIEAIRNGAINMGQGSPEFAPDPSIIDAARGALGEPLKNQYSEDRGFEGLRNAIAEKYKRFYNWPLNAETQVTVFCGVTEAIVAVMLALVNPGEKMAIIEPAHENYLAATFFAGAEPFWISLTPPDFRLDMEAVECAFKSGVRYIILNTPHNPTGRVFDEGELTGLASLCVKYDVIVITDEIYEHILYDGLKHMPMALLPGMDERTITTSGVGKTFGLTGWRIGYAISPPTITHAIRRVHTYLSICAPTPLQYGAVKALNLPPSYYEKLKETYAAARMQMMQILKDAGFAAKPPQGAYYVMADFSGISGEDDLNFCLRMVRKYKVAAVPGSSFYKNKAQGRNLVRFAFPKPPDMLAEVGKRLQELNRRDA